MMIRNQAFGEQRSCLQMTPMIDIVFQLLVFFLLTFRISAVEGDFNVHMPANGRQGHANPDDSVPPIRIRLRSAEDGELASIEMNDAVDIGVSEQGQGDWGNLRDRVIQIIGLENGPSRQPVEVVLDCDATLRYQHVIHAITAVSGYRKDGEIIQLVERINFAN